MINLAGLLSICFIIALLFAPGCCAGPVSMSGWTVAPDASKGKVIGTGEKTVLRVTGTGSDDQRWKSPDLQLKPGSAYLLKFTSKSTSQGGYLPCGAAEINRDFTPTLEPTTNTFVFSTPSKITSNKISLGEYYVAGSVDYSNVELSPIQTINFRQGSIELGEGESLENGVYRDYHNYGWIGSNIHRTLHYQYSAFNSNRWVIARDSKLVYRYLMPLTMTSGTIRLNCNYYIGGKAKVAISADGENYNELGELSKVSSETFTVPSSFFPAKKLFVMISSDEDLTSLQIDNYQFEANTDYKGLSFYGKTLLVEERTGNPALKSTWVQQQQGFKINWENTSGKEIKGSVAVLYDGVAGKPQPLHIPAGKSAVTSIDSVGKIGSHKLTVKLTSGGTALYVGSTEVVVSTLRNDEYGYRLKSETGGLDLWWCESNWKVGPNRGVPAPATYKPVSLSAAKGEYEAVQVVITPSSEGNVVSSVVASGFADKTNKLSSANFSFYEVAYVPVRIPSDSLGEVGEYPDPLPQLTGKLTLRKGRNQSIWVSVHVPENAAAGKYRGNIKITTNKGSLSVPMEVVVYDFTLPKAATLSSAFGLSPDMIKSYNKLNTRQMELDSWDKWMKNFAEHRISPYSFYAYAPINMTIQGDPNNRKVVIDWTEFDKAAVKYLDGYNLSSFQIPLQGLGGGTFYDRALGEMDGHKAGTPEYEKLMEDYLGQVEQHLKEKGWLSRGFVYWFDEPEERDYPFVIDVMERLKKYAPGLQRMLTEQPEPPLYGHVDIWCGLTSLWSKKTIEQRTAAGEKAWWYICTGPKAPYAGEFIEHPGTEMRLWIWQTWQYNVTGVLIWTTNWWTSGVAFPDSLQNPWEDAMSYVDGYGTPKGAKNPWGNGDGRFLYPARRDPNTATEPYLGDPISSVRWEALRDGMEDYEYFSMLKKLIEQKKDKIPAALKSRAETLLIVPAAISKDLTTFTPDPRPMLVHRDKLARMIERLKKL